MDLFRSGEFIIDAKNGMIAREGHTASFNFEEMYMYNGAAKSQRKPIYYDNKNNNLLYWVSGKWTKWNGNHQEAVNKLFEAHAEYQLLGD